MTKDDDSLNPYWEMVFWVVWSTHKSHWNQQELCLFLWWMRIFLLLLKYQIRCSYIKIKFCGTEVCKRNTHTVLFPWDFTISAHQATKQKDQIHLKYKSSKGVGRGKGRKQSCRKHPLILFLKILLFSSVMPKIKGKKTHAKLIFKRLGFYSIAQDFKKYLNAF